MFNKLISWIVNLLANEQSICTICDRYDCCNCEAKAELNSYYKRFYSRGLKR